MRALVTSSIANVEATYTAETGTVYTDCDHSSCLFQAQDANELEVQWFPHGNVSEKALAAIEARMGFRVNGEVLSRNETLLRYGFELMEEA